MSKHTPGPWRAERAEWGSGYYIKDKRGVCVAHMLGEHEANAKLIAQAPELLEELERLRGTNAEPVHDVPQMAKVAAD